MISLSQPTLLQFHLFLFGVNCTNHLANSLGCEQYQEWSWFCSLAEVQYREIDKNFCCYYNLRPQQYVMGYHNRTTNLCC